HVHTSEGDMHADGYVMALGSYSPVFLRSLRIDLPIYPMKGYSITIDADDACPAASITDGTHKLVYTRLGNRLRVAGTAEFAGYNTNLSKRRVSAIVDAAKILFPKINWSQDMR